jgi:hypothetical protein
VDGQEVFSKLATGRMPTAHDLVLGLERIGLALPDADGDDDDQGGNAGVAARMAQSM